MESVLRTGEVERIYQAAVHKRVRAVGLLRQQKYAKLKPHS